MDVTLSIPTPRWLADYCAFSNTSREIFFHRPMEIIENLLERLCIHNKYDGEDEEG